MAEIKIAMTRNCELVVYPYELCLWYVCVYLFLVWLSIHPVNNNCMIGSAPLIVCIYQVYCGHTICLVSCQRGDTFQ